MQSWVSEELETADLGDERLDRRFALLLEALARRPALKFPAACKGRAEVQGAYRFVNHPRVTFERLLAPHCDATLQRCRLQPLVLVVQDTSEIDVTRPNEKMSGSGPLSDDDRLGFFLHPLFAFSGDGLPLGCVHAQLWARDPDPGGLSAAQKAQLRKQKSIEQKESFRWVRGYRQACELARACPDTQVICLSDSEGDIFECFFEALKDEPAGPGAGGVPPRKADWVIRACEDRALVRGEAQAAPAGRLFEQVAAGRVLSTLTLEVRQRPAQSGDPRRKRKQARSARKARVTVRAARVRLREPARPGGKRMADVAVNAVLVREEDPPAGEEPIEWLLLTNLPIDTLEQVLGVVAYYCRRWGIELYFKVLKSGCRVEASQLETAEAFLPYLALCLAVSWRVMYLLTLGRECPEMPCDDVLDEDEWQSV